MRKIVFVSGLSAAIAAVGATAWRRNPRLGTAFMNWTVNPALVRRGLAGGRVSEIGMIEHVGRRSGIRRLTPVHPEPTRNGFRVLVPLGVKSEWARNVLVAGGCRLHLHDAVFDLDEPVLVGAAETDDRPWPVRRLMAALGFRYLTLRSVEAVGDIVDAREHRAITAIEPGTAA
jgi:hypothetical protein